MKKKNASMIIMLVLLVSLSHALITLPESVRATTLYVGGAGPGNYTTIQSAIDAASPGDTIYVFNGTYHEHVIVNKPLSLIGEDRDRTIVDGSGSGDVVNVTVDWVNITGFVVTNSGQEGGDAGIELHHVQNCYISYNVISRNDWGIFLDSSTNNSISNNTASYNRGGITLFSSYKNNLFNNTLSPDNANGIFLYDSENNTITSKTFSNNGYGIYFWAARDNMVANNNVYSSIGTGIYLFSSSGNTIFHNNIVDNARQARNSEINTWDNGYPSGGNYWSDYTGSDQFSGPNQDIAG
ncbi:MAG: nitrous oxide reductase family maturation protein NosD, partial [Thermoplasmata archaeon]